MSRFPAGTVLKITILLAWGMVGIGMLTHRDAPPPPQLPWWTELLTMAVAILLYTSFGWAGWLLTGTSSVSRVRVKVIALLLLQVFVATTVWTDLFFILAAEVPFVLPRKWATGVFACQVLTSVFAGVLLSATPQFSALPNLEHLSPAARVFLTLLSFSGWQIFAFLIGLIAASEASARRELARMNAELLATRDLLAESTRMAERRSLSRELHDSLGHHLTVLSVNLQLAARQADGKLKDLMESTLTISRLLLAEVRDVVRATREPAPLNLSQALRTLGSGIEEPRVRFEIPEKLELGDPAAAHGLFRCAQEAITNSVRHSGARDVWIRLGEEARRLILRVEDNGRGADRLVFGNGLRGMRERIEALGGHIEVRSGKGRGLVVEATLPVPGETA